MFFLILFGALSYDVTPPPKCIIDRCENDYCVIETPEGVVEVKRRPHYREGEKIDCPTWLVEPT